MMQPDEAVKRFGLKESTINKIIAVFAKYTQIDKIQPIEGKGSTRKVG
jgi:hypothetical protein